LILTRDDIPKLTYLKMCIKEGLRLHSPVPFVLRQATAATELDGVVFPEGTRILVHLYNLHHNEAVWPEPHQYRPDRFTAEAVSKRDTFAFVPFSAGPRCVLSI
jgi:cytochrome P450